MQTGRIGLRRFTSFAQALATQLRYGMPMRDFITVVSGLPRSGTSLMMQMLAAGGIPPLTDEQRGADESNPRGYFEYEAVKRLRSDQSWLEQARGHAVKIIHVLMRELPADGRFQYRVLLMRRPLEEVLSSQRAMLERQGKQSADPEVLAKVYQAQLAQLEQWMAGLACFAVLPVPHGNLISSPAKVAGEIAEFLGGDLEVARMAASVDPALYRERLGT
jgi:hypothetical protein